MSESPDITDRELNTVSTMLALVLSDNDGESAAALGMLRQRARADRVTGAAVKVAFENAVRMKEDGRPIDDSDDVSRQDQIVTLKEQVKKLTRRISYRDRKIASLSGLIDELNIMAREILESDDTVLEEADDASDLRTSLRDILRNVLESRSQYLNVMGVLGERMDTTNRRRRIWKSLFLTLVSIIAILVFIALL
jgi:hypothetical protein